MGRLAPRLRRAGAAAASLTLASTLLAGMAAPRTASAQGEPCQPGRAAWLEVRQLGQEADEWCWVAVTRMVVDFLTGSTPSSCDVARPTWDEQALTERCAGTRDQQERGEGCDPCNRPLEERCTKRGWPPLAALGFLDEKTEVAADGLEIEPSERPWSDLAHDLSSEPDCGGGPVIWTRRWNGGGGHQVVLFAFLETDWGRYLLVRDPLEWYADGSFASCGDGGTYLVPYEAYVGGEGYGWSHWRDRWNVRPKPDAGASG